MGPTGGRMNRPGAAASANAAVKTNGVRVPISA